MKEVSQNSLPLTGFKLYSSLYDAKLYLLLCNPTFFAIIPNSNHPSSVKAQFMS